MKTFTILFQRFFFLFFLIFLFFPALVTSPLPTHDLALPPLSSSALYIPHASITINSTSDFVNQDFPGNGSFSNPFRIEGLNITSHTHPLIMISNVSVYFLLQNNFLDGVRMNTGDLDSRNSGILINNCTHGVVSSNIFSNLFYAIRLQRSSQIVVTNNTPSDCYLGVSIEYSFSNTLSANIITNCSIGIWLSAYASSDNMILGNVVAFSGYGIMLSSGANGNTILDNSFNNNRNWGIILSSWTSNNLVTNNSIFSNRLGIRLWHSSFNTITHNLVYNNDGIGIILTHSPTIVVPPPSNEGNLVEFNDFLGNNLLGESQAIDDCLHSIFRHNYWSDLSGVNDSDDFSYAIFGTANNTDSFPSSFPINSPPHVLSSLIITTSQPDEFQPEIIHFTWLPVFDFHHHSTDYSLYFSFSSGNWTPIVLGLSNTSFSWDSWISLPLTGESLRVTVLVKAICSEGFYSESSVFLYITAPMMTATTTSQFTNFPSFLFLLGSFGLLVVIREQRRR